MAHCLTHYLNLILACLLLVQGSYGQLITRFLNEVQPDEFPNPDPSCAEQGCYDKGGYKDCLNCCKCRCDFASYWSATGRCLSDDVIARDCKYVLNSRSFSNTVAKQSADTLRKGAPIFYCPISDSTCLSMTSQCVINRGTTLYDNKGLKPLWKSNNDVDMSILATAGATDKLQWFTTSCSRRKYDGLLISLGVTCKVAGNRNPVSSCLVFKVAGSYTFGTNPMTRMNCSTTTQPMSSTASTQTTAPLVTSGLRPTTISMSLKLTTPSRMTSDFISMATTTTAILASNTSTVKRTATATKTAVISPLSSTTSMTRSSSTSHSVHKHTSSSQVMKTTASAVTTQPAISLPVTSIMIPTTISTTKLSNTVKVGQNQSKPSNKMILAASLSAAALICLILIGIPIAICMKRRYSSNTPCRRTSVRRNIVSISSPRPLTKSSVLPPGTEDMASKILWTIDGNGDFIPLESAPVFTLFPKDTGNDLDDNDDDDYEEPISRRTSSLGRLYAVVKKRRTSSKKEKEDGYATINDTPKDLKAKNSMLSSKDIEKSVMPEAVLHTYDVADGNARKDETNIGVDNGPIYDKPNCCLQDKDQAEEMDNNGPIYAIYEPSANVNNKD